MSITWLVGILVSVIGFLVVVLIGLLSWIGKDKLQQQSDQHAAQAKLIDDLYQKHNGNQADHGDFKKAIAEVTSGFKALKESVEERHREWGRTLDRIESKLNGTGGK